MAKFDSIKSLKLFKKPPKLMWRQLGTVFNVINQTLNVGDNIESH